MLLSFSFSFPSQAASWYDYVQHYTACSQQKSKGLFRRSCTLINCFPVLLWRIFINLLLLLLHFYLNYCKLEEEKGKRKENGIFVCSRALIPRLKPAAEKGEKLELQLENFKCHVLVFFSNLIKSLLSSLPLSTLTISDWNLSNDSLSF